MRDIALGYLTLAASPRETIKAAAAAGFASCGVRLTPRSAAGRNAAHDIAIADPDNLARMARNAGIRLSNVTCYQLNPHLDEETMRRVVDATQRTGARLLVMNAFDLDRGEICERYARYCELAASAGLRLAFEFIPYSAVRDLTSALHCVERAGSAAACLTIDLLHLYRSGDDVTALDDIAPEKIALAQLCDAPLNAPAVCSETLRSEAREGRLELGAGGLPILDFLDGLPPNVDIEYEVPALLHRDLSPCDKAHAARRNIDAFLEIMPSLMKGA